MFPRKIKNNIDIMNRGLTHRLNLMIGLMIFTVFLSCEDGLGDLNYDQKRITDELLTLDANEGGFQLPGMQLGIIDVLNVPNYGMQQFLNADNFSGYAGYPLNIFDNRTNMTYSMVDQWNNQIWRVPATKVLDQWVLMKRKGFDQKYPDLFAIATLFKVFAGHRLVDIFGPIPYSLYGTSTDVPFDSVEKAYSIFFSELSDIVDVLKGFEDDDPDADQIRYAKFDRSRFGGDYSTWIKVANTLRLRLAIRISKIDPEKARIEAESAVNAGGFLTGVDGAFEMNTGTVHPWQIITENWGEGSLNASLESYLLGYGDPRLSIYAKPATHSEFAGIYKGVRSGPSYEKGIFLEYSRLNFVGNPYVKLMDPSESLFLRAEGALRGWNMEGTAQEFYEDGIRTSFRYLGAGSAEQYINNDIGTQRDYIDPINEMNNAPALSHITVKWDENATFDEKLERIITQKWIALYPEGQEAWSEFRRTGYPKLWPVVVNFSNGEVPDGDFIKRIPYPTIITNVSSASVLDAVESDLGGRDGMFTSLWWDVD